MLPVEDRQRGAFTVLLVLTVLTLIPSCTAQSQVIGSSQPVVALAGDDIMLPCHLEPAVDASNMLVEWARPDLDPRFVLVWRDGIEMESKKHGSYRGRTSLFTDQLKHGNVSLKLSTVKRSDEGTYRCFFPLLHRVSTVQLVCESDGWYPEPELLWLDAEGSVLPAGPAETLRRPDGLYNVSSRVTVEKRHGSNFTCRVQQKSINQSRETLVHVPDDFFMVPSTPGPPGSPGVVVGSVIGCAALLLIPAVVFAVWKWRQRKSKTKSWSPEDGPEHTEGEKRLTSQRENSGLQVVMEGGEEGVPLMSGREEENDADDGGEEEIRSQSEQKDKTHQDHLVTKPDMDRTEGERGAETVTDEQVALIPAEQETLQKKNTAGRQISNDYREQRVESVEEDSGQKEQLKNLLTDQKVPTREDKTEDEDRREANIKKMREIRYKKTEQPQGKKDQKRQQARKPIDSNSRRNLNSEKQNKKEGGKDEMELKPQRVDGTQNVLGVRKHEESKAEHNDKNQIEQEGNLSHITNTTERRERELQTEVEENIKIELKTQRVDGAQNVLEFRKHEESKAEDEDKKQEQEEENLSHITNATERRERELQTEVQENTEIELKPEERGVKLQVLDGSKQEAEDEDQRGNKADITAGTERKEEKMMETEEERVVKDGKSLLSHTYKI
ncbi:butyrophilin-like protein 1 [Centropristis striata]|uniref:butyrophilin-like protein 1 n=1 Tax=Centropristis striata TaxID=184440 RepID=UPI0027DFD9BE|nr:butyrophilin-like protein 1 [Centropristis striata]